MATVKKSIGHPGLRVVIIGQGRTKGRRSHLLRIRETLYNDLKAIADGPFYLVVEQAIQAYVRELRSRSEETVTIVLADNIDSTQEDFIALEKYEAKAKKASAEAALENKRTVGRPLSKVKKAGLVASCTKEWAHDGNSSRSTSVVRNDTTSIRHYGIERKGYSAKN